MTYELFKEREFGRCYDEEEEAAEMTPDPQEESGVDKGGARRGGELQDGNKSESGPGESWEMEELCW